MAYNLPSLARQRLHPMPEKRGSIRIVSWAEVCMFLDIVSGEKVLCRDF